MEDTEQRDPEDRAPPSVIDRYFTRWYRADMKGNPCEDHCVLQHSNRLCVVTLAETHPLLQNGRTISKINYQISDGCSRLNNKVSGKSKRGGQFLTDFAPLCRITCTDDTEYTILSCIRGRLLEVNECILERPALLLEKPSTEGYIAVILPKLEESKTITKNMLSREEFEKVVAKRSANGSLTEPKEEFVKTEPRQELEKVVAKRSANGSLTEPKEKFVKTEPKEELEEKPLSKQSPNGTATEPC